VEKGFGIDDFAVLGLTPMKKSQISGKLSKGKCVNLLWGGWTDVAGLLIRERECWRQGGTLLRHVKTSKFCSIMLLDFKNNDNNIAYNIDLGYACYKRNS
jgi:hypothetical protein